MLASGVLNRTFRANVRNELVAPILAVRCCGGAGDATKSFSV